MAERKLSISRASACAQMPGPSPVKAAPGLVRQIDAPGREGRHRVIELPAVLQLRDPKTADQIEHAVAGRAIGLRFLPKQPGIDQSGQPIDQLRHAGRPGYRLGRVQRATAGEHRKLPEKLLLMGREEIVAPLNRAAHRLMPGRMIARSAGEQIGIARELLQQSRRGERLAAGGRQLDRQRHSAEPAANIENGHRIRRDRSRNRRERPGSEPRRARRPTSERSRPDRYAHRGVPAETPRIRAHRLCAMGRDW